MHQLVVTVTNSTSTIDTVYETSLDPFTPLRLLFDPLVYADCSDTLINVYIARHSRRR